MVAANRKDISALEQVLDALEPLADADRAWVLRTAADRLSIPAAPGGPIQPTRSGSPTGSTTQANQNGGGVLHPKTFMAEKKPTSDVQKVACLAYFLTKHRDTPHFKTVDLTKLNTEAAGSKMGNPAQAVANATKLRSYLAAAGGGKKQLTHFGEQIVDALPDQAAAMRLSSEETKARPKRRKKNAKEGIDE